MHNNLLLFCTFPKFLCPPLDKIFHFVVIIILDS
jgi:hypothetical protein